MAAVLTGTTAKGGGRRGSCVLLLQRYAGDVLRVPLVVVKTTGSLMAPLGVLHVDSGGFPSCNSGDGPVTSTSSLLHRFQIEEKGRMSKR